VALVVAGATQHNRTSRGLPLSGQQEGIGGDLAGLQRPATGDQGTHRRRAGILPAALVWRTDRPIRFSRMLTIAALPP